MEIHFIGRDAVAFAASIQQEHQPEESRLPARAPQKAPIRKQRRGRDIFNPAERLIRTEVRSRLVAVNRCFAAIDQQAPGAWGDFGEAGTLSETPFASPIANFYMTCPISRASRTMAECMATRAQAMAAE